MPPPTAGPSVPTYTRTADDRRDPLRTEWLLTNGLGGFAMGTVLGVPTRRYHGLLVAAQRPPVDRVLALGQIVETVTLTPAGRGPESAEVHYLTPLHFHHAGERAIGCPQLEHFERDVACRWTWRLGPAGAGARVDKLVHLFHNRNAVGVRYTITPDAGIAWTLDLHPLTGLRDFHSLRRPGPMPAVEDSPGGVRVRGRSVTLRLLPVGFTFHADPHAWQGIEYMWEDARGLDAVEEQFCPGVFAAAGNTQNGNAHPTTLTLIATTDDDDPPAIDDDIAAERARIGSLCGAVLSRHATILATANDRDALARLAAASDDFIVLRGERTDAHAGVSIIAGYPWFADWGRDTMIALPGLLLAAGRYDEARRVLTTFARARRRGLIPNRFDDYAGPAHFNTIDAPLWFIEAACGYLEATGDRASFDAELGPACLDIIRGYREGTDHGIGVDPADGLVTGGDANTQLTWMDAQRDGVTFTPRYGKAVEINALWHNALVRTAEAIDTAHPNTAAELRADAERTAASFRTAFVRTDGHGLHDRLEPDDEGGWRAISEIRPNQLFAVSLPRSPLDDDAQQSVVDVCARELLTPHGVRTLSPADAAYKPRFDGTLFHRDAAYHQGTAWPWLIGPMAEATLRAGNFSNDARAEARAMLEPLIDSLDKLCPGQLAEVYDGDDTPAEPQRPGGCPAQAWSIAEVLRVLTLVLDPNR